MQLFRISSSCVVIEVSTGKLVDVVCSSSVVSLICTYVDLKLVMFDQGSSRNDSQLGSLFHIYVCMCRRQEVRYRAGHHRSAAGDLPCGRQES